MHTDTLPHHYADAGLTDAAETGIKVDPAPTPAELLEARWLWTDALVACGDPQPPADWSALSAKHGD